jgi:aubergine-like protein
MINVDLSTKVMNKQTVYTILMEKFNRINDAKQAQDASLKELVGQIVITPFVISILFFSNINFLFLRYNNETYKILDIAWDKDPTYEFTKRDGTKQTLAQYYQEVR